MGEALPWLERFDEPARLRVRPPLGLYACRDAESLGPRLVLVGSAEAAPQHVQSVLDRLQARHRGAGPPGLPAVAGRGLIGEIAFVALRCEAVTDLEAGLLLAKVTDQQLPLPATFALFDRVAEAVRAVHMAGEPGAALGVLGLPDLLIGSDGALSLLALGTLAEAPEGAEALGSWRAPELAFGARPTASSDVYCLTAMFLDLLRVSALSPQLEAVLAGGPVEAGDAVRAAVEALEHAGLARTPARRAPAVDDLLELMRTLRRALGVEADAELLRQRLARWAEQLGVAGDGSPESREPGPIEGAWQGERYEVQRPIDSGATATVVMAYDRQLRQRVAMKMMWAASSPVAIKRFHREVRILRRVNSRHLVRGYDLFEERGRYVGVMEYVEGPRLDVLLREARLTPGEIVERVAEVADALASLHRLGIVHRDVKPSNVIVHEARGAVLVDYGAASDTDAPLESLTRSGTLLGSLQYAAPELLVGAHGEPAADVFSLGVVLWEALAGAHPFPSLDPAEQARQKAVAAARVGELDAQPHVRAALAEALAAEPRRRVSATRLATLLRQQDELGNEASTGGEEPALRISGDARTVVLPDGAEIDLSRRRALRLIVEHLAARRLAAPDSASTLDELQAAGWPGERLLAQAGKSRVYVALSTLRRLGLDELLRRRDDGYLLDPAVPLLRGG